FLQWDSDLPRRVHVQSITRRPRDRAVAPLAKKEERLMETTTSEPQPLLKIGDRVRIRHASGLSGRVVELRGPLGPGGSQVYRVMVRKKPTPSYVEVRADQLEIISSKV